ncbi:MAG: putative membrane protein YgcG [Alphaproteobacteria bacterium]
MNSQKPATNKFQRIFLWYNTHQLSWRFDLMVRVVVLTVLIAVLFGWADIVVAVVVGGVLAVLLVFSLMDAARKGRRRLRYDDTLDPRYRDVSLYALWIGLSMNDHSAGAYDPHAGGDTGMGGDFGGGFDGGGGDAGGRL